MDEAPVDEGTEVASATTVPAPPTTAAGTPTTVPPTSAPPTSTPPTSTTAPGTTTTTVPGGPGPTPVVDESPATVLLPVSAVLVTGLLGLWMLRRRAAARPDALT